MKKHKARKHLASNRQSIVIGLAIAVAVAAVGILVLRLTRASGTASFSLNPASGSKTVNSTFTVSLYENSGTTPVNAVDARLTYDQTKLQFVSSSISGGAFEQCPSKSGGSGSVRFACGIPGETVTGNQLIGTITFKALASSGSSAVTFASNSHILRSPDAAEVWNGATTGATYTFAEIVTPTPTPSSTATPSKTPTPTSTPKTPTPSPKTSSAPTTSQSPVPTPTASSAPSASPSSSTEPSPAIVEEEDQTYPVGFKVTNQKGEPVAGAEVTIGSETRKTDATGVASFVSVKAGKYTVKVKSKEGVASTDVTVAAGNQNEVQLFAAAVKPADQTWLYVSLGLAALLMVGTAVVVTIRRRKTPPSSGSGTPPTAGGPGGPMVMPSDRPIPEPPLPQPVVTPDPAPAPMPEPVQPDAPVVPVEPAPAPAPTPNPDATPSATSDGSTSAGGDSSASV